MALWPPKKDSGKQEPADTPLVVEPGSDNDALRPLTERLAMLEVSLHEVASQVVAYLVSRPTAASCDSRELRAVGEKLDMLAKRLDEPAALAQPTSSAAPDVSGPMQTLAAQLRAVVGEIAEATSLGIRQMQQQIERGFQEIAGLLRPAAETPQAPAGSADWQRAILGCALAEHPTLGFQRQQLLDGVLEGNAAAMGFAGQLLVFQSAAPEKMPALLKEIGESYYRWQPKMRPGATPLEQSLVAWLLRVCEDAGLSNTIELVDPGERFDNGRHTASDRGVEITQVLGWIVLRDNGKVYTKALVTVK